MSSGGGPTKKQIEDKVALVIHNFQDQKRRATIPQMWAEFIRDFATHVKRRSPTHSHFALPQNQQQKETKAVAAASASAAAASTSSSSSSSTTKKEQENEQEQEEGENQKQQREKEKEKEQKALAAAAAARQPTVLGAVIDPSDPMIILLSAMDQNLLKSQNKDLRKASFALLRDVIVLPAPPVAPRANVAPPNTASRTLRFPQGPLAKLVSMLLSLFQDQDETIRTHALETLKFYMQVDNEVVYSHIEDITLQTLVILQSSPTSHDSLRDKRNQSIVDFITSLTEIIRSQMRSQRTDQQHEYANSPYSPLPPVFNMSCFVTLIENGLALAAEKRSDAICGALVGKFLSLLDGSEDISILSDFHRLIGPLLELVKHRETAAPANMYLTQQQRNVDQWISSPLGSRPHHHPASASSVTSSPSEGNRRGSGEPPNASSAAAAASGGGGGGGGGGEGSTASGEEKLLATSETAPGGKLVEFNRVAAIDSVILRFQSLNSQTCSAYPTALQTFLNWLVLLLYFRDPLTIPKECGQQIHKILALILMLDSARTTTLHERLELVFRRWPDFSEPKRILEACMRTFHIPERRGTILLKWLGHVIASCYSVAAAERDQINSHLLECMNDPKDVHALALQLMCRLAKRDKSMWETFIAALVKSMHDFKARIPTCFCMLQQFSSEAGEDFAPSFVIIAAAKYIQQLPDKPFRAATVKTLSLLICTAMEFDPLRRILREGTEKNKEARETFSAIFPCWSFNAAWSVGLCLLTREFTLANALVEEIAAGDVTAFVLEQLHRVVQLFESPCFAFARVALLRPKENPFLVRALFGVLMLLPQESTSFGTLHKRLECVSQQQQALVGVAQVAGEQNSEAEKKIAPLVDTFRKMQAELELQEAQQEQTEKK